MRNNLFAICFFLLLATIGYGQKKYPLDLPPAEDVSIINLIANPQKYDKKTVQVVGYLNIEFERDVIYLHREDCENGLTRNGLWVNLPDSLASSEVKKSSSGYNKKYVIMMGTFHNETEGSLFSGSISNIIRLELLRP